MGIRLLFSWYESALLAFVSTKIAIASAMLVWVRNHISTKIVSTETTATFIQLPISCSGIIGSASRIAAVMEPSTEGCDIL